MVDQAIEDLQADGDGEQALPRPVMEVALQAATFGVAGGHDAGP